MNKKKIVVFGGSGFLGSHVADELTNRGYKVTVFDIKKSSWIGKNQIFFKGDILNEQHVEEAIKGSKYVFNFAAISDLNIALNKAIKTVEVNVLGVLKILEACRKYKVHQYVHASTIYVSGNYGGFYKSSKLAAESYVEEYYKRYGLNYSILRYGTLYGPRSDVNNGLHQIVRSAIEKNKIIYSGNPNSVRDYIHVVDAAKSSAKALKEEFLNKKIIISGYEKTKVEEILKIVSEMMKIKGKIKFVKKDTIKQATHYKRTPYSANEPFVVKYNENFNIDIDQGIYNLINELSKKYKKK